MDTNLASRLKTLIQQRGLTAAGLARQAGLSVASLSRILSGQTNPSFQSVSRIAAALGVGLESLSPAPTQATAPLAENTVRAVYTLENTDHSTQEAGQLMLQAALGSWSHSWMHPYVAEGIEAPTLASASQSGSHRQQVQLAFPHQLVEGGSVASLLSVVTSALSGTGARLLDVTVPPTLIRTFSGPAFGLRGLRDTFNKHGRPLLACTIRPMHGLSPRLYGRAAFEALIGGVDITVDPALLHSIPSNPWRERFRFVAEAAAAASRETNEFKTHAVNITAPTMEDMLERATWAKELELAMVMVDTAAIGWSAVQSLGAFCAKNELILCALGTRSLNGSMLSEQLQAKLLRICGADAVSTGSPLRGNVSNRRYVTGVLSALRDDSLPAQPEAGHHLPQPFEGLTAAIPAVGGGHNPWQFPRLIDAIGDNALIQCGGAVMSHPWGGQAGATACRTAIEALVQARGEGHNLNVEGRSILLKAAKYSPDLKQALDTFQEGSFLFGVVHTLSRPTEGSILPGTNNPSPTITPFRRPEPTNED